MAYKRPTITPDVVLQMLKWLCFGMLEHDTFLNAEAPLNIIAGQSWTLLYEWLFYFSLPILSVFATNTSRYVLPVVGVLLALCTDSIATPNDKKFFLEQFLFGMAAASVARAFPQINGDSRFKSIAAVFIAYIIFHYVDKIHSTAGSIACGLFFLLIATGSSCWGILTLRSSYRLGNISYSIYLLHGLILVAYLSDNYGLGNIAFSNPYSFWLVNFLILISIILISTFSYCFIEKKGIDLGKKLQFASIRKQTKYIRLS